MSQPDINVAIDYAVAQSGKPYHAYGNRFGPNYFDCSGLVVASLRHAGIYVPNYVGNTVGLYQWARNVNGLISVDKGVRTRGAIMIKGRWYGYGALGHTSFSLGDGREMAAHGSWSGIHVSDLRAWTYQDAFIIPGVNYHLEPPVDPQVLVALAKLVKWGHAVAANYLRQGETSSNVSVLNDLLISRGLLARKHKSNTYSRYTRAAVHRFKHAHKFPNADGRVFGGKAALTMLAHK